MARENRQVKPDKEDRNGVPEIAPVAAGAIGVVVVGGLALLTARRRSSPATPNDQR